jgi:hypothetical protein
MWYVPQLTPGRDSALGLSDNNEKAHFQPCMTPLAFSSGPARRLQPLRGHADICRATNMRPSSNTCRKRILAHCVMVKKRHQS